MSTQASFLATQKMPVYFERKGVMQSDSYAPRPNRAYYATWFDIAYF